MAAKKPARNAFKQGQVSDDQRQEQLEKRSPRPHKNSQAKGKAEAENSDAVTSDQSSSLDACDTQKLCVVGIGASAGGLEAFTEFLAGLPPHLDLALVFVQHLDPHHKSNLVEILSRSTSIPVVEATDSTPLQGGQLYVMPADRDLAILHGVLHLLARPESTSRHLPIDAFFRSLAEDQGSNAIGVILSGTGSDGALGIRAIKAEGGITMVQERASAKYDGMPAAAIATGHVDFVLPPKELAKELARIARNPVAKMLPASATDAPEAASQTDMQKVLLLLRRATGMDFSYYKRNTVERRVARRMVLHRIESLGHYARYLQQTPGEAEFLFEDLLINVTSFFRDPDVFEALRTVVFPSILKQRPPEAPIRIWVPACSTGEEAYSIAITLLESLGEDETATRVQIFGTDVSRQGIEKARQGTYPENIEGEVSPDRLRRFFVKVDSGYQIRKSIRDMCVFANQNVIKDPPFSHLDLISCRNLLIYMTPVLQQRIIPSFHYALKGDGYLVLGGSETIGDFAQLFSLVDKKHKIYAKKDTAVRLPLQVSPTEASTAHATPEPETPPLPDGLPDLEKEVSRIVLSRYGPPGVVVNEQMEIVRFRGQTGRFLEPAPGAATWNLMKMTRPGLAVELRAALHKAQAENAPVRKEGVRVRSNGSTALVNLEVIPMGVKRPEGQHYLVLFEEVLASPAAPEPDQKTKPTKRAIHAAQQEIDTLRAELASAKQTLQSIIEEHEATNEELRAANEEVQSSNEELQSTNEELTTAKEELQSTNEELTTLNEELENRNAELRQAVNDLNNLLNSVNIPILILGNDLSIRSFTPLAERTFRLIPADVRRPIGELRLGIEVENLEAMVRDVIDSLNMREETVRGQDDRWYNLRIRPYRTTDNKISGAVLSLIDVTERKRIEELLQNQEAFTESLLAMLQNPMVVLDSGLRVVTTNQAFDATFHFQPEQLRGVRLYDAGDGAWNRSALHTLLEELVSTKSRVDGFPLEMQLPGGGHQAFSVNATHISQDGKPPFLILLVLKETANGPPP
jgi:two-component system CheB/CheR fusion protein